VCDCVEERLIELCAIQDHLAIVGAPDGACRHSELAAILDIDNNFGTATRTHPPDPSARIRTFFEINLRANFDSANIIHSDTSRILREIKPRS
jgi:hypothetical protein